MQQEDFYYYQLRAEIETERAATAAHPKAVAAHYQLATMYFERLDDREDPSIVNDA